MPQPSLLPRLDHLGEPTVNFRPIRPAVSPTQRHQPIIRSRANISSACLLCKQRKRKCLGGQPCPACFSTGMLCLYDEALDRRRKLHNDKTRADSDFQRRLLNALLTGLKSDRMEPIVNLVRADASIEDLARELGLPDIPESFSLTETSPKRARTASISSQTSVQDKSPPQSPQLGPTEHSHITQGVSFTDNPNRISPPNLIRLPTFQELNASLARSRG